MENGEKIGETTLAFKKIQDGDENCQENDAICLVKKTGLK